MKVDLFFDKTNDKGLERIKKLTCHFTVSPTLKRNVFLGTGP